MGPNKLETLEEVASVGKWIYSILQKDLNTLNISSSCGLGLGCPQHVHFSFSWEGHNGEAVLDIHLYYAHWVFESKDTIPLHIISKIYEILKPYETE